MPEPISIKKLRELDAETTTAGRYTDGLAEIRRSLPNTIAVLEEVRAIAERGLDGFRPRHADEALHEILQLIEE